MSNETLVLDKKGDPYYVEDWQEVVRLHCLGSIDIIAEDDTKILHSDGFEMGMPRVVKLKRWAMSNMKEKERVTLSRRNLLIRDSVVIDGKPTVICQYCGTPLTTETYTADHVIPRSKGGLSTWTNLVASCKDCNFAKSNKTLEESRLRLLKKPVEPNPNDPRYQFKLHISNPHSSWKPWLYWNVELEK